MSENKKELRQKFFNSAVPFAIAALGYALIPPETKIKAENILRNNSLAVGFATGLVLNLGRIGFTLYELRGKTTPGNHVTDRVEEDGTVVFKFQCEDSRRVNKNGLAIPGSSGPTGSWFVNASVAMLAQLTIPNPILKDFTTGVFLSNNLLTELYSNIGILFKIGQLINDPQFSNKKIKIEMMNHQKGCGAEAFTNILSLLVKFITHDLELADKLARPNEFAGNLYINKMLGPLLKKLHKGRLTLVALNEYSKMIEVAHH